MKKKISSFNERKKWNGSKVQGIFTWPHPQQIIAIIVKVNIPETGCLIQIINTKIETEKNVNVTLIAISNIQQDCIISYGKCFQPRV